MTYTVKHRRVFPDRRRASRTAKFPKRTPSVACIVRLEPGTTYRPRRACIDQAFKSYAVLDARHLERVLFSIVCGSVLAGGRRSCGGNAEVVRKCNSDTRRVTSARRRARAVVGCRATAVRPLTGCQWF